MLDHENRVREEFTRQAETFSVSAATTDAALTQRFLSALGEAVQKSVLDLACGPGILSAAIAKGAREVVAFDLTPQMLKKAAQRCLEAGVDNVTFREGNATELPFADAAFDAVVTRLSVHHFDRPGRVFEEIFRILRPGGSFVIADVISSEVPAEAELQNAIGAQALLSNRSRVGTSRANSRNGWVSSTTPPASRRFARWCGRWPAPVRRPAWDCRSTATKSGFSTAGI